MEHKVEAQVVDSHHLRLKKPIQFAPGSTVTITIKPAKSVSEDQEWYLLSFHALEAAYGDDEPDYSMDDIKIPNPEYQP